MSRNYDLFGVKFLGYTNRPGTESLKEQISKLKKDTYHLFDDDIHTGGTIRFVKSLLEEAGSYVSQVTALNISAPENSELLDCRDFFIGGEYNGLVVTLPNGKLSRVPYVYPYACPLIRGSVGNPMKFSIDVWKMNMGCFQNSGIKLSDRPFMLDLYEHAGFNGEDTLYDVCKWHYDMLKM